MNTKELAKEAVDKTISFAKNMFDEHGEIPPIISLFVINEERQNTVFSELVSMKSGSVKDKTEAVSLARAICRVQPEINLAITVSEVWRVSRDSEEEADKLTDLSKEPDREEALLFLMETEGETEEFLFPIRRENGKPVLQELEKKPEGTEKTNVSGRLLWILSCNRHLREDTSTRDVGNIHRRKP